VADWLISAVVLTIFAVIGFAVAALVINWVGRIVFNADVSFNELVRTLGLAYVWNVIGLIGVLAVSDALACLLAPVMIIAGIATMLAWFWAAKEALDLEWVQTIVTVILGFLALLLVTVVIGGLVLGAFGLGAAVAGGLFGS
jgi:hypothetical protein